MIFNKDYYDSVFPDFGVHRHDYVDSYAMYLFEKYGAVKFLDIGCGCGALVKKLRELGMDAWGLDISEYAIANSCAPEHVILGDIRNLPFEDKAFDVVHTQGVLGYFPKEETQAVIIELKRVGNNQEHNIDYEFYPEHGYNFIETKEWWEAQLNGNN